MEPQPLWEYPCVALGQPTRLLTLCLSTDNPVPEQPIAFSGALDIIGSTPQLVSFYLNILLPTLEPLIYGVNYSSTGKFLPEHPIAFSGALNIKGSTTQLVSFT